MQQISGALESTERALGWMNHLFQTFYSTDMFGETFTGGTPGPQTLPPGHDVAATITLVAPQPDTHEVKLIDPIYTMKG